MSRTWLLVPVFCLVACTHTPTAPDEVAELWQRHRQQVNNMALWQLQGRMSLATPQGSASGGLYWRQQGEHFQIRFAAPLGQGSYELSGDEQEITLRGEAEQVYRAEQAEALLHRHFGGRVTLAGLRYWVLGLPDPNAPGRSMRWDAAGRMSDLEQHGFRISILRYQAPSAARAALPTKLFIHNDTVRLRLVVRHWDV